MGNKAATYITYGNRRAQQRTPTQCFLYDVEQVHWGFAQRVALSDASGEVLMGFTGKTSNKILIAAVHPFNQRKKELSELLPLYVTSLSN